MVNARGFRVGREPLNLFCPCLSGFLGFGWYDFNELILKLMSSQNLDKSFDFEIFGSMIFGVETLW